MANRHGKPQILTASDLLEGDVIYLAVDGIWTRNLKDACVFSDDSEAKTALAAAGSQQDRLVGPYLADVSIDEDGSPSPSHFRESFRATGPSNYFHGKQAG